MKCDYVYCNIFCSWDMLQYLHICRLYSKCDIYSDLLDILWNNMYEHYYILVKSCNKQKEAEYTHMIKSFDLTRCNNGHSVLNDNTNEHRPFIKPWTQFNLQQPTFDIPNAS
jgi:hypothetical protein